MKRDVSPESLNELEVHLESELFPKPLKIYLRKSPSIIASNYKLVVRNGHNVSESHRAPKSCVFTGSIDGDPMSEVTLSTCHAMNGVLLTKWQSFVIKSAPRSKRQALWTTDKDDKVEVLIEEAKGFHKNKCGIKPGNQAKMTIADLDDVGDDDVIPARIKRATNKGQKTIELAVFVDDVLYDQVAQDHPNESDIKSIIEEFVFTYLNAVQLMYQSDKLQTKIRIVLVLLDIFERPEKDINKHDGYIEKYLDSFCEWQESENKKSSWSSQNKDHWDHGLLLTGLDLHDGEKEDNGVIGLAWVAGMCHPRYSCTINEGHNFESVFVIAHEMGHKYVICIKDFIVLLHHIFL